MPLFKILDEAIESSCADFGNIQIVDPGTGDLEIVAQRGFSEDWIAYWNRNARAQGSCGSALESGSRVIVENVTKSPIFRDRDALEIQLRAGVWACQSTPLFSAKGAPVGVFNTHYRQPGPLASSVLDRLDKLAQKALRVLERA